MEYIAHRRNTIQELQATPNDLGVEMDLRSYGDRLIVHHEPFVDAVDFSEWLNHYRHGTLILNVKEEGIEYRVRDMVEERGISNYFFLDLSFPFLIRMVKTGEDRVAVRWSEYESIETVLSLAGRARWVWVDCFSKLPVEQASAARLRQAGFRLCIVSPELQGRDPGGIAACARYLQDQQVSVDAVCTKHPDLWQKAEGKQGKGA